MPAHIKDVDRKRGIVTGYCSSFDVVDSQKDVVKKGAFARTINAWGPDGKNRIKNLFMHDPAWLVGRPLVLKEDDFGLYHETQISQTSIGKDVLTLIADGVITEQSIGYDVIQAEDRDDGIRELKELRLWEYSWVTWGANEVTPVTGMKSLDPQERLNALLESMARFEKALKHGSFQTDEVPEMIELALRKWREEVKLWEDKLREAAAKTSLGRGVITIDGAKQPKAAILAKFTGMKDYLSNLAEGELWERGWRLMDAMYDTFREILRGEVEGDPAQLLAESLDQFKEIVLAWAKEMQERGLFGGDPESVIEELTDEEAKAIIPGLCSFAQKLMALSSKANPAKATSPDGDSPEKRNAGDSAGKGHSLDVSELVAPLDDLKRELQAKQVLDELREFSKSLRITDKESEN